MRRGCEIMDVVDSGLVVELSRGISGFVHRSKMGTGYECIPEDAAVEDYFKMGDWVDVEVIEVSPDGTYSLGFVDQERMDTLGRMESMLNDHPDVWENMIADW